jgi:enoyl-CoA hydratase/carnithine racemase
LLVERRPAGTEWLVLDRPDKLNAFTATSYAALRHAVERATIDPDVRSIVITGNGRAFSAGADRALLDGTASPEERQRAGAEFTAMLEAFVRCDKPVLAAVNGLAVGIGATILLHCDLVVVARSARLRFPFTALGVVPEAGSSALLPTRTRWADAMWAMLSSEWIDAEAAHAMGLAWRVVPDDDVTEEAQRAATTIAAHDPAAVMATKRLLVQGRSDVLRAAMERELAAMAQLVASPAPRP